MNRRQFLQWVVLAFSPILLKLDSAETKTGEQDVKLNVDFQPDLIIFPGFSHFTPDGFVICWGE